ncbi:MAG: YCF48-related protein [Ignavibacteria bacterium]
MTLHLNVRAEGSWVKLISPTPATLRNCSFVDELNGWAAGDNGIIVHTSNGGDTFVIQNNPVDYYINDIFFLNKRLGWAVANEFLLNGTTLLTTTNGGINWTAKFLEDTTRIFRTVYFLDSLNGYLGGFGGAINKTTDAGNSWFTVTVDSSEFSGFPIAKFKFVSANIGYACGGQIDIAGVIWKTTDSGSTWNAGGYSPEPFYNLFIKNSERIISVGGDFEYGVQISKTTNGGSNWNYQSLGLFGQAYSIDFRNSKEAWMPLGYARHWAVSFDTGMSWTTIPVTDSAEIYSVDFTDSLHGWAFGLDGVILKYTYITNITNENLNIPSSVTLFQNYPNPFNPKTKINYELKIADFVSLKIFDVQGKEIQTLVNENKVAGSYTIDFKAENLPSGIYYYKLETGNFSQTKKLILLK